ncbi:hypothetical protein KY321_04850 [Candidatus Woesearchaeota archaeon]|nr:hypothetical protein [Candidatus Woesearchaeota archaeon]
MKGIFKTGLAATVLGLMVATNTSQELKAQEVSDTKTQISKQDSKTQERKTLIDKISKEFPSPYVGKVIYETNYDNYVNYRMKQVREDLKYESRWKATFKGSYGLRKSCNFSLENFLGRLAKDEDYKEFLTKMDIKAHKFMFLQEEQDVMAVTPFTDQFDKKAKKDIEKSRIYFFPKFFKEDMKTQEYSSVKIPLESRLRVTYIHETQHARQNIDGFDLGEKDTLGKYDFVDMIREVKMHVMEAEAHYKTYMFVNKNLKDPYAKFLALDKLLRFYKGEKATDTVWVFSGKRYAEIVKAHHETYKGYSKTEVNTVTKLAKRFLSQKEELTKQYHELGKKLSAKE